MNNNSSPPSGSRSLPAKTETSRAQASAINSRMQRKVLPEDTYDRFARSLYGTVRASHENKDDNQTTMRKMVEAFHGELCRLHDELQKKLPPGRRP